MGQAKHRAPTAKRFRTPYSQGDSQPLLSCHHPNARVTRRVPSWWLGLPSRSPDFETGAGAPSSTSGSGPALRTLHGLEPAGVGGVGGGPVGSGFEGPVELPGL